MGWTFTALGLLVGVPTGLAYHVRLRACLEDPPRRWWLRPVSLHEALSLESRPSVLRWFYLGGAGFALTIVGCLSVGAGVFLAGARAGVF